MEIIYLCVYIFFYFKRTFGYDLVQKGPNQRGNIKTLQVKFRKTKIFFLLNLFVFVLTIYLYIIRLRHEKWRSSKRQISVSRGIIEIGRLEKERERRECKYKQIEKKFALFTDHKK